MRKIMLFFIILYSLVWSENYSIEIDASSYSSWVYYNFTLHSEVQIFGDPYDNLGWDIAFQRNHIKTNSGTSGSGMGGASVDSLNLWTAQSFNDTNEIIVGTYFAPDTLLETFYDLTTHTMSWDSTNPNLETWGTFDFENNYTLVVSNNQLIVRTANGDNFIKIWPYDYYNDVGSSGHISIFYSDDIICPYEIDDCGVCGGNNNTCILLGDVNLDYSVDIIDIIELIDIILMDDINESNLEYIDLNEDLNVDIFDIIYLINLIFYN